MEADSRNGRYLDTPIQHSYSDMLWIMQQKTIAEEIKYTIIHYINVLPGMHFCTSLIVGFPGKMEKHFEHLLDFFQEMELENVVALIYLNEAQAMLLWLLNHVPNEII
ncbi:hypothetical protein ACA910_013735 [Epithemia clementina (nom. ined.)]